MRQGGLKQFLKDIEPNMVVPEGIDHAFLGIADTENGFVAVYSVEAIVANLMQNDMMDFETAEAHTEQNICSPHRGKPLAPIFVDIVPDEFYL